MAEVNKPATKKYRIKKFDPVEQKGQVVNRNPRITENGGIFNAGDVVELTPERMKQLGEKYFEEVKEGHTERPVEKSK